MWTFETADSIEQDKPEGRCNNCWNRISQYTNELNEVIEKQDHKLLTEKLGEIEAHRIEIDLKVGSILYRRP